MANETWSIVFGWGVAMTDWAAQVEPLMENALRDEAPEGKGDIAGALKDSIQTAVRHEAGLTSVEAFSTVPYAGFVVKGTAAHPILPKRGKYLRFEVDGAEVFARRVQHPGTKANDFPERAAQSISDTAETMGGDAVLGQVVITGGTS